MAKLKRIHRTNLQPTRRGQTDPRRRPSKLEGLRAAAATLGLYVLLTGVGFAAIYAGSNYLAYLLDVN